VIVDDLTELQRQVVEATERRVLVIGGPGTGKTTTALWSARQAITSTSFEQWQNVLFLTFSRTAVNQIVRKAPSVMHEVGGRIEVMTFHGLAYRLLSGFGRYAGAGLGAPQVQTSAQARLLGKLEGSWSYAELIPMANHLLESPRVADLVRARWPLVICDEFQDTGDDQWELVQRVANGARMLLMADPDQMIYTFVPGVSAQRIEEARESADRIIELEPHSHRDPSGAIPALARAVYRRQFDDDAVTFAVEQRILLVTPEVSAAQRASVIRDEIRRMRREGCRTIGIFGMTNVGVAELGKELSELGVGHALIGISEAHGEALAAMARLGEFAVGTVDWGDAVIGLATFLTACTRGEAAPPLALAMVRGDGMPAIVATALAELRQELRDEGDGTVGHLAEIILSAWYRLKMTVGARPWRRAAVDFISVASEFAGVAATPDAMKGISDRLGRIRTRSVVGNQDEGSTVSVQLMNFHQAKGREVDGVILVYGEDEYHARRNETEPYVRQARVQYVAISRARRRVSVLLPLRSHPVIAPFARIAPF
jgi:DNA helicase II / ATP-dependent DNA helicase PcrA